MLNRNRIEYSRIRQDTLDTIDDYVKNGFEPGDFIMAVLTNNLSESIGRADQDNLRSLPAIVSYVFNEIPEGAWGSQKKVDAWLKHVREENKKVPQS